MAKGDAVLGDFHKPSNPEKHNPNSIGNQQVWYGGKQVGAIEAIPNAATGSIDLVLETNGGFKTKL